MEKIERLKKEALWACRFRGHKMSRFRKHHYYAETVQFSHCLLCDKQVVVNSKPMPNDIDICGEAVALGCQE